MGKSPANKKNETGNRYGRLVVLYEASYRNKRGEVQWVCMCDCGKEKTISGASLRNGNTRSCGCLLRRWPSHILPVTVHKFSTYQTGAKKKGREFTLTVDEFQELILQPCYYCGVEPSNVHVTSRGVESYYSGIDRVDSRGGYTSDNVVPCCKECNYAKSDKLLIDFCSWIDRISSYPYNGKLWELKSKERG